MRVFKNFSLVNNFDMDKLFAANFEDKEVLNITLIDAERVADIPPKQTAMKNRTRAEARQTESV